MGGGGGGRGSWGVWGEVNRGRLITITMATTSTIIHNYLDRLMLLLLSILILVNLFTEMLLLVAACPELCLKLKTGHFDWSPYPKP